MPNEFRATGDNDNNKLYAIGCIGADSRRCGLSNSRHDYAPAPAIDHSLMKRSSDTFAEFLPRSSIIHLSHALDSSIFHRGHPASIHHTVDDYINPLLLAGYANRSGLILILIQIIHRLIVIMISSPQFPRVIYLFFFSKFSSAPQFFRTVRDSIVFRSQRCSIRWNLIFHKLFLETYLRYRIFCKNISSFRFLRYFVLLFD